MCIIHALLATLDNGNYLRVVKPDLSTKKKKKSAFSSTLTFPVDVQTSSTLHYFLSGYNKTSGQLMMAHRLCGFMHLSCLA